MAASNLYEISVGWRLCQARRAVGLHQAELAEELGVDASVVQRYERGIGRPPPRHLLMMAYTFGVSLETLFTRWNSEVRPKAALSAPRLAKFRPLVDLWSTSRGRWSPEIDEILGQNHLSRTLIVRRRPRTSRLIFEHIGEGMKTRRPQDTYFLPLVGRDMSELPDREYGAWMEEIYDRTLARRLPRLDYTEAVVSPSSSLIYRIRHDRLILPWMIGNELFALGVSMPKELAVAS
jgi:transcriptional regulator with XRE-family HTH domain